MDTIPGLGIPNETEIIGLTDVKEGGGGTFIAGHEGVVRILTPLDRKIELIIFRNKTLVYVKSAMGYPAIYPLPEAKFAGPAEAVLMDLDGTSVHSESFWIWIIEQTIARLSGKSSFHLETEDEPHVSGHSVSEHLQYCIDKYNIGACLEDARKYYFEITDYEMKEITAGRGRVNAFTPAPGLKPFLTSLKQKGIKIGLVTSGLYEKAWPEIVSAFRTLDMGDPLDFYDCIITAGQALRKGQTGTLGELSPKPHPWLYAETARVGLGLDPAKRDRIIGIEDSSAGIVSIRLAGFTALGMKGGNISSSGADAFIHSKYESLLDTLPLILG